MESQETLIARLDERYKSMDKKLDSILLQVVKTNGRVDDHDEELDHLNQWRAEVKGNINGSVKTAAGIGALIGALFSVIANLFR